MLRVHGRHWVFVSVVAAILASTLAATTAYRSVIRTHDIVEVSQVVGVVNELPAPEGEQWENLLEQGNPGSVLSTGEVCRASVCEISWGLVPRDRAPDDFSVLAQVTFYGARLDNQIAARRDYFFGPHSGWRPDKSGADREFTFRVGGYADDFTITCYTYQENPDKDTDCLWSYYARYGQYIMGILYGSSVRPIDSDTFLTEYVSPFDRHIAELLGIA